MRELWNNIETPKIEIKKKWKIKHEDQNVFEWKRRAQEEWEKKNVAQKYL